MSFKGFEPVYDEDSRLLILGSFPSVKSRAVDFYYGNQQNRFWRVVCGWFGEEVPSSTEGKKEFLHRRHIALWDVVTECDIDGSRDDTIRNFLVADIPGLLANAPKIGLIICNGGKSYEIFCRSFRDKVAVPYRKLPSTSPLNTRFTVKEWEDALQSIDGRA